MDYDEEKRLKNEFRIAIPEPSINRKDSPHSLSPVQKIDTMAELQQFHTESKNILPELLPPIEVDPAVLAQVMHTVTFQKDPSQKSAALKKLHEEVKSIQEKDPEQYQKMTDHILTLNEKYDGDISAQGIQRYKEHKKNGLPTSASQNSASESPNRKMVDSLSKAQSMLRREVALQEKTLEEMKSESREMKKLMGELTLQAAEDAQNESNMIAKISIGAGVLSTLVAAAVGAVATYFSGTSSSNDCHCTNGTHS